MGTLGAAFPKALLPLATEPLIAHHLRLLAALGIGSAHILVGYRSADIIETLGDDAYGVSLEYVEQGPYLGSAHALGRLRDRIREPFVLLLGDYYCALSEPKRLVHRLDAGVSAIAAKREANTRHIVEACEVRADADGRIREIVEKPSRPTGNLKGCGVYALQPDIFDAVARTPRTALRDEYELTHALQLHIAAGGPTYAEDIVVWDRNFTRPEDILEANLEWLARTGQERLVATEARIEQDVHIERTVVGDHAHVATGSRMQDVVVFSGVSLRAGESLSRALVTHDGVYRFGQQGTTPVASTENELLLTGKEGP
jgi:NDP-sugar pyrophosphorylase family protein